MNTRPKGLRHRGFLGRWSIISRIVRWWLEVDLQNCKTISYISIPCVHIALGGFINTSLMLYIWVWKSWILQKVQRSIFVTSFHQTRAAQTEVMFVSGQHLRPILNHKSLLGSVWTNLMDFCENGKSEYQPLVANNFLLERIQTLNQNDWMHYRKIGRQKWFPSDLMLTTSTCNRATAICRR